MFGLAYRFFVLSWGMVGHVSVFSVWVYLSVCLLMLILLSVSNSIVVCLYVRVVFFQLLFFHECVVELFCVFECSVLSVG